MYPSILESFSALLPILPAPSITMFFMRCFDSLHLLLSCSLLATSAIVSAQEQFESPDFNVTEALLKNGVDVSDIPALSGLVERSSVQSCAIAV